MAFFCTSMKPIKTRNYQIQQTKKDNQEYRKTIPEHLKKSYDNQKCAFCHNIYLPKYMTKISLSCEKSGLLKTFNACAHCLEGKKIKISLEE